ncbi:MAG: polyprenyl synthetase family protein [Candidatus Heimdallarchaeota archaeon]
MEIKLALMENIRKVNDELQVMIKEKGVTQTDLGAFGDVFYREFVDYLNNGGKRIRPFLVKTAFDAVGGNHADGNIIRASLAIELLHNGSLLHDDVIDKDETRRGKPSFHVIFRELYKEKKGIPCNFQRVIQGKERQFSHKSTRFRRSYLYICW